MGWPFRWEMRTRHAVPRGERQFMVADILDIIYRAHSHRLNCQIPCHPSFWPEGLWLPQTPTSLIMLLINRLAACRSSAWVLFNSLARSCEGKPLESSQQRSPGTVHPTGTPPNRAVLRDTHCQQLSADSWEQWLSGIRSVRKRGRLAKPRAAQSSAVTQHGAAELLQGPEGLPAEMQRETDYFCKNNSLLIKQCFLMKYHSILHLLFSRSISIALKLHSIYLHVLSAVKIRGVAGRKALRFTLDFSSSVSKMEFWGLGEGGGKILSSGNLGSSFTIPGMINSIGSVVPELPQHNAQQHAGPAPSCAPMPSIAQNGIPGQRAPECALYLFHHTPGVSTVRTAATRLEWLNTTIVG